MEDHKVVTGELYQSKHLILEDDGFVWAQPAEDWVRLGHVDNDPSWSILAQTWGSEPGWFQAELGELQDRWRDAVRFSEGCRDEAHYSYRSGIGDV